MKKATAIVLFIIIIIFGLFLGAVVFQQPQNKESDPQSSQATPTPTPLSSQNIRVSTPILNQEIGVPLSIKGEARVFESVVRVRLRDANGMVLVDDITLSEGTEIGEFGPFEARLSYPAPSTPTGVVEVFQNSPRDGSEVDKVTIPVTFKQVTTQDVQVFFTTKDSGLNCEVVWPVIRRVERTPSIARVALLELLEGPTITDQQQGFRTNIPDGVTIQRFAIEEGIATVDFSDELQKNVAGSCTVLSIRSQITETLMQFPTVEKVVISINGETEDVLQP